jgi:ABC-type spermidine/putrescine transport system permease subunit I
VAARVTRLGKFSPFEWLFALSIFCENFIRSTNNWATFFKCKSYAHIITKMYWATVWATFTFTHLVTLVAASLTFFFFCFSNNRGKKKLPIASALVQM